MQSSDDIDPLELLAQFYHPVYFINLLAYSSCEAYPHYIYAFPWIPTIKFPRTIRQLTSHLHRWIGWIVRLRLMFDKVHVHVRLTL